MTGADLPAPERSYYFKVYLTGVAEPTEVHAARYYVKDGQRIFLDRDDNVVQTFDDADIVRIEQ